MTHTHSIHRAPGCPRKAKALSIEESVQEHQRGNTHTHTHDIKVQQALNNNCGSIAGVDITPYYLLFT